jgi:murein DD-endopeptidase MepM/ murein hydrolase activator NlpD
MRARDKLVILVLLVTLISPTMHAGAQAESPYYVIQTGDTLSAIARAFGTTVQRLIQVNSIADPSVIFPGMEIAIPGFEGIEGELVLREVQFGENLSSLSVRHGIPVADLVRLNRIVNPERIFAGQRFILPAGQTDDAETGLVSLRLPQRGDGRLALAVEASVNPWHIEDMEPEKRSAWVIPGMPVMLPAVERLSSALPDPVIGVELRPLPLVQGHTTVVQVEANSIVSVEGMLGETTLHFFPSNEQRFTALQGIHAMEEPGLQDLLISFHDENDRELYAFNQPVMLDEGGYGFENINGVPPETINTDTINTEQAQVDAALAPITPQKYWEGTFRYPSDYYTDSFISIFGTRRSYNWGALSYYHTGVDFYAGTGVPILASAAGVVAVTGEQVVRGKFTYIDHGWGVYSGYFHESEILVEVGDVVEPGQVIGLVGNTGRSTGAHLHWEIWVGGVPADPIDWVETPYP